MRIKEGILPLENTYIRKDLTQFYYGGYAKSYLGVQCIVLENRLPVREDAIYIEFISPLSGKLITFCMKKYEIEYL